MKKTKQKRAHVLSMESFLAHGREVGDGSIAYMLRTCDAEMQGYGGFQWPKSGAAEAPDWNSRAECGGGLHGLLWGEGSTSYLSEDPDARWMVCAVWSADVVSIDCDKVKVPRAWVVFVGERYDAVVEIQRLGARAPCFGTATAGDAGTATAGYAGTATAGDAGTATAGDYGTATAGARGTATAGARGTATAGARGTATAGYAGTATAGDAGTATAGDYGTATAGDYGTATAGARGTATAGYAGTATAGDDGTATVGYAGTATAGARGTATAGDYGTATAGYAGTATAGYAGIVCIKRWNGKRYKMVVGHIGEDGLIPNVRYKLGDSGCFVRADGGTP